MGSFRSRYRRRRFAVAACVLWLLGVEVLPNLHLAAHRDDHTHTTTGAIAITHVAVADHSHDESVPHRHATAHHSELAHDDGDTTVVVEDLPTGEPRKRDQLAIEVFDPGHAAGGLAHRLIALHQPAPPVLAPVEVPRMAWWLGDAPIERTHAALHARPSARGPPVARA